MRTLTDFLGREVRLTAERLAHILEHPELRDMEKELERVVGRPQLVRRSRTDDRVALHYGFCAQTSVGSKWLCVVVKYDLNDAFIITAYLTGEPKAGENIWPTR